jgi:putative hydrolase of the HAD superfamily
MTVPKAVDNGPHSLLPGSATSEGRAPLWLVFDYGEVISRQTDVRPELADLLRVPLAEFCAAYAADRDSYDRGWPDLRYWQAVGRRLGIRVDEWQAAACTRIDIRGWVDTRPEVLALLGELAATGAPLALLSNAPRSHGRAFRSRPWASYFRHLLFSGDMAAAKPDQRVWDILAGRLGAEPADCFFFDDRQVNVDSAVEAGLTAERWTDTATARRHLAHLGLLAARTPTDAVVEDREPGHVAQAETDAVAGRDSARARIRGSA